MTSDNKLKIGSLGCVILSVFARFVADFHGLVSMYQNTISIPANIYFALTMQQSNVSHEIAQLAGMLLGISALIAGITAGIVISSQMALFFHRLKNRLGFNACILIIAELHIMIWEPMNDSSTRID